ncbi:MAG: histone [Candidatus Heimdallarchaeota archaeon]
MLQSSKVRELLKRQGNPRVSKESVHALNNLLTRRAKEISTKAVTLAQDQGREEIREEDITQAVRMGSSFVTFEVDEKASVVHYVWFISSGGTCLLSRGYSGLKFPDTIFAGLLTGILDLFGEVTGRRIDKFSTDDLTIHCRRIGEITVAVICDSDHGGPVDELTELLAKRFDQVFSDEISMDVIDTSVFEEFTPVLDALVTSAGMRIPTQSLKVLPSSASLTDRQLEETVDAAALRQELKRAQTMIQDLMLFKREDEPSPVPRVDNMLNVPQDVAEIQAVIRQASKHIRSEIDGANGEKSHELNQELKVVRKKKEGVVLDEDRAAVAKPSAKKPKKITYQKSKKKTQGKRKRVRKRRS